MEPVPVPTAVPNSSSLRSALPMPWHPAEPSFHCPLHSAHGSAPLPGAEPRSPHPPPPVPIRSIKFVRRGRELSRNLQQLEPPTPPRTEGVRRQLGSGVGEVPPSLPMLSPPRLSLAGRQEQAPAPPRVTRGRSARVVAGWGGTPKLTRSGAASGGARTPRPQEPKHGWAGREPRLCSSGDLTFIQYLTDMSS